MEFLTDEDLDRMASYGSYPRERIAAAEIRNLRERLRETTEDGWVRLAERYPTDDEMEKYKLIVGTFWYRIMVFEERTAIMGSDSPDHLRDLMKMSHVTYWRKVPTPKI